MESVQFGSEVSDVQEELVRLNLKILSMIDSFINIECQAEMDSLNGEIRAKLDLMRKGVENLRSLARQQLNPESAVMLKTDANSHEDQMTGCHLAFKKANIACMSRLNSKGRENLMSKGRRNNLDMKRKDKEEMVSESGKATEDLRKISRHLAQTVERSAMTMNELVDSSKTMDDANEEFKTMGAGISQARRLITKFGRRETTDRLLILLAAAFFFSVVFYILKKRVFGPLDPFELLWSSITAFVRTVLNLLLSKNEEDKNEIPIQSDQKHTEL